VFDRLGASKMLKNRWWSVVLVCTLVLGSPDAWAKRLGGGLPVGKSTGHVTQGSGPSAQTAPAAARADTAVPAPKPAWGGMLGGLAAGLGLAWLASSLGLGEALGQLLLWGLLAVAVAGVLAVFLRRRRAADAGTGAGWALQSASGGDASQINPVLASGYSPKNVGNDASARPWERQGGASVAQPDGAHIGASLSGAPGWGIPAGFDVEGFLQASKANFRMLQAAWDRADIPSLRAMMTDAMLAQIQNQLAERERLGSGSANTTDVVMLEAHLLGIEEMDAGYMASVEFSGLIREDASAGPNPFREIWNITRPKSGSGGWLVAGVQALQ